MNEVPEKGRDTTVWGSATDPKLMELPGRCSVPGPSLPDPKYLTENGSRLVSWRSRFEEPVLSVGWRTVAAACHASGGQCHD